LIPRPDRELRRIRLAAFGFHLACRDFDGLLRARDAHAQVFERRGHGPGDSLGEHRQDSWIGVEESDIEEPLRVDVLQAVCGEHRVVLCSSAAKLDAIAPAPTITTRNWAGVSPGR